jgi:GNAT superfamily N-acetyltransferase
MAVISTAELIITDDADSAVRTAISEGIARSNRAFVGNPNVRPLIVTVGDSSSCELQAGLWGRTAWDWLHIELLYVSERARGAGLGTKVVRAAEIEALQRRCRNAWVYTYSFQAPGFYERLGYTVFGILNDYPPGHQRFFLRKSLAENGL